MKVGSIAVGRSGDKGETLDLTLVAIDEPSYRLLEAQLTTAVAYEVLSRAMPGTVRRYEVPNLLALKYVVENALPGGVWATLHAGLHWQKAAIALLLDLELSDDTGAETGSRLSVAE
jgi:hypothetical protein